MSSLFIKRTSDSPVSLVRTGSHCHSISENFGKVGDSLVMIGLDQSGFLAWIEAHCFSPQNMGSGMKCKNVVGTNRNGNKLVLKIVPKKSHKVNSGSLCKIFQECIDLVMCSETSLTNNSRAFIHTF